MPNWLGKALVAAFLVMASIGPKLWLERRSAQVDADRLNEEIVRRLEAANFHAAVDPELSATAVRAWRPDCHLIVRNGDRSRELGAIFKLEAMKYGPVMIGYRDAWSAHPTMARAVLERFMQDGAARLGFDFGRPAVVALAQSGTCRGVKEVLAGLVAHASVRSATGDTAG